MVRLVLPGVHEGSDSTTKSYATSAVYATLDSLSEKPMMNKTGWSIPGSGLRPGHQGSPTLPGERASRLRSRREAYRRLPVSARSAGSLSCSYLASVEQVE